RRVVGDRWSDGSMTRWRNANRADGGGARNAQIRRCRWKGFQLRFVRGVGGNVLQFRQVDSFASWWALRSSRQGRIFRFDPAQKRDRFGIIRRNQADSRRRGEQRHRGRINDLENVETGSV